MTKKMSKAQKFLLEAEVMIKECEQKLENINHLEGTPQYVTAKAHLEGMRADYAKLYASCYPN